MLKPLDKRLWENGIVSEPKYHPTDDLIAMEKMCLCNSEIWLLHHFYIINKKRN